MSEPYRPANGSAGEAFIDRWCGSCQRDAAFRADEGDSCPIVAAALLFGVTAPEYPSEWIWAESGPVCAAWLPVAPGDGGRIEDARQAALPGLAA